MTENVDLVGLEYLWKSVLVSPEAIVHKPIELLKDVYTNLSTKLQSNQVTTVMLVGVCSNHHIQCTVHIPLECKLPTCTIAYES